MSRMGGAIPPASPPSAGGIDTGISPWYTGITERITQENQAMKTITVTETLVAIPADAPLSIFAIVACLGAARLVWNAIA